MTVAEVIAWLENWADPRWQESWDNCGWQVDPGVLSQKAAVLVCLTPTLPVMQEALSLRDQGIAINLILAHHPLIFQPLKSLQTGRPIADLVRLAFTHQVGIYTAHTNLDQAIDGVSDVLGQVMGLQDAVPMVPGKAANCGLGRVGTLDPAPTLATLLTHIQDSLQPVDLTYSPEADLQQSIHRLAVLGGSGASFIETAVQLGAQAYLTSDCRFHQFQESRDRGLVLIDAGHFATERPACARLVEKLQHHGVPAWLSQRDEDFRQFFSSTIRL
ncbi:MAG: Nif3-like dinuclear metal center hexameric protein [Cyanobacteria bacterium]|nr:Nif3-like dinuclear metal center hexameric protein [Cyanobacteriota bacterium]MDW8200578.1 Nif3-like dinuclear metal center hexameric protein [Cyanobacteriota bacterium SKYGB_h_bin112]